METLKWWTTERLPNNTLMSLEEKEQVLEYLQAVYGICSEADGNDLGKFDGTQNQVKFSVLFEIQRFLGRRR